MKRATVRSNTTVRKAVLAGEPKAARYRLQLFVTGTTPRSARAIQNLRTICEENLQGRYDLEDEARATYLSAGHPREGFKDFLARKPVRA